MEPLNSSLSNRRAGEDSAVAACVRSPLSSTARQASHIAMVATLASPFNLESGSCQVFQHLAADDVAAPGQLVSDLRVQTFHLSGVRVEPHVGQTCLHDEVHHFGAHPSWLGACTRQENLKKPLWTSKENPRNDKAHTGPSAPSELSSGSQRPRPPLVPQATAGAAPGDPRWCAAAAGARQRPPVGSRRSLVAIVAFILRKTEKTGQDNQWKAGK